MDYIIRLATENDCEELSHVKHAVWETTYRGIYSDEKIDNFDYEKSTCSFKNIVNNPDIELYVVEIDNKLIGYMDCGVPFRPFRDYKQEIGLLYLLEDYQGRGIGRDLFNVAYKKIKENGYDEFFVSCNKYNLPAQKFYEKMGGELIYIDVDNVDKAVPQKYYLYKISK